MPSPANKERREKRLKRNLLAKELQRRRWRQRRIDKNYKRQKIKERSFIDDTYSD